VSTRLYPRRVKVVAGDLIVADHERLTDSRDGSTVLLFQASSASGSRYVGPGVQVWEHQGEARVRWGLSADDISCRGVD